MPADPKHRLLVLHSAASKDAALAKELLGHFRPLERFAGLDVWSEARVLAGAEPRREIERAIDQAEVALLLLSPDFFTSDALQEVEVPRLLDRHRAGKLRVVPVLLRSCFWDAHPWLSGLKPLLSDGKAIDSHQGDDRDRVLTELVRELSGLLAPSAALISMGPPGRGTSQGSVTVEPTPQLHNTTNSATRVLEPQYPDEATRLASKAYQSALERLERLRAEGVTGAALDAVLKEVSATKRSLREGRQLMQGDVLRERYLILDRIGKGGSATVWKAKDLHARTVVAVKVLHGHCTHDRTQRERFKIGIREMSRLEHPHIVRVLEPYQVDGGYLLPDGEVNGGEQYFVMEYLEGGDLNHALRTENLSENLSSDRVWQCLEGVASALEYAHSMGIIHRDVKPENILLALDGTAKLTDFDLARLAESSHGTRTGALGSVFYAAPEMHSSGIEIDARADIYSLAMTVVFAMRRRSWTYEEMYLNRSRVLSALGNRNLTGVLSKALAVKRDQRYSSVRQFWDALHSALSPQSRKRAPAPVRGSPGDGHLADLLLRAHRTSPTYKPACILAVLDAIEAEEVSLDRLDPEVVFRRFDGIPEVASGMGWQPFFHLSTDGFWEFVKEGRKVDRIEFGKRGPNTRRKLLLKIDFAVVPDAHKAWWLDANERSVLRRTVIEMLGRCTPESGRNDISAESVNFNVTVTDLVPRE